MHRYFYGNDNPARFIDTTGHAGQEAQRIQYEGFNVTPQGYTESLKFSEGVTVTASPDRASAVPQQVGRLVAPVNRAAEVGFRAGGVAVQATAAVALAAAPDPTGATKLGAAYLGLRAADEGQALVRELRSGQPTMSEAQKGLGIAIQHATGADPDTANFYGGVALTGVDLATGVAIARGAASTVEEGRAAGRSKMAPAAGKSEPSAPVGQHGVNLLDPVPFPESGESYIYSDPAKYAHNRSKALQESLSPTTRGRVTMSASVAEDPATGERVVLIGTSERRGYIRPGVGQALKPSEVVVPGTGHAEADISAYAKDKGYKTFTGAGRPHCPPCVDAIEDAGGAAVSPRRPVKTAPLPRKDTDSND